VRKGLYREGKLLEKVSLMEEEKHEYRHLVNLRRKEIMEVDMKFKKMMSQIDHMLEEFMTQTEGLIDKLKLYRIKESFRSNQEMNIIKRTDTFMKK
jgi:hypothetical protein